MCVREGEREIRGVLEEVFEEADWRQPAKLENGKKWKTKKKAMGKIGNVAIPMCLSHVRIGFNVISFQI